MSESNISTRTSSRARTGTKKKKANQLPIGVVVFVGIIAFSIYLATISAKLALFWILGGCFGFILQKSRFCFTASMRDPYLTGSTSVTRAVLIAFAVTTIGFAAV
jgi:hypothetical protein